MGKTFSPSPSLGPGSSSVGGMVGLAGCTDAEVGCWGPEAWNRRPGGIREEKELELSKRCCLVWVLLGTDPRLDWTNQRLTRGNVYEGTQESQQTVSLV